MAKQKGKSFRTRMAELLKILMFSVLFWGIIIGVTVHYLNVNSEAESRIQSLPIPTEALDSELTIVAAVASDVTALPSETLEPTATITNTPVPSATLSLEDIAIEAVEDAMTAKRDDIEMLIVNDIVVTLRFPLNNVSAGFARREAELMFPQLVCNLRDGGLVNRDYQITGMIDVVDALGNRSTAKGVEMILPWSVTEQLNCENVFNINLAVVAERWSVSPLLEE